MFPTYIDEDYAEFLDESNSKIRKLSTSVTKNTDVIAEKEFKFITDNFIHLMQNFTKVYYEPNIVETTETIDPVSIMKDRLKIFSKIFLKYKNSLTEDIDGAVYNTCALIFGEERNQINNFNVLRTSYDYYKDSNIPEILTCTEILDAIEVKVKSQLQLYPDHATLLDVSIYFLNLYI